jgi:hypothetical protein
MSVSESEKTSNNTLVSGKKGGKSDGIAVAVDLIDKPADVPNQPEPGMYLTLYVFMALITTCVQASLKALKSTCQDAIQLTYERSALSVFLLAKLESSSMSCNCVNAI